MIVIQQPKILLQMVLILNSFFHILFEFCPYHYIDGCLDGLCGEKVQFGSFTHRYIDTHTSSLSQQKWAIICKQIEVQQCSQ